MRSHRQSTVSPAPKIAALKLTLLECRSELSAILDDTDEDSITLINAITGLGKSYQTSRLIEQGRIDHLVAGRSHDVAADAYYDRAHGVSAIEGSGIHPRPELCEKHEEVVAANKRGANRDVVCLTCPLRPKDMTDAHGQGGDGGCAWRTKEAEALDADHRVLVHQKYLTGLPAGRNAIHEEIRPMQTAMSKADIRTSLDVFRKCEGKLIDRAVGSGKSPSQASLDLVRRCIEICGELIPNLNPYLLPTSHEISQGDALPKPWYWEVSVDGIASEMRIDAKAGAALRAITAIATGQAKQWTNVTHRTKHSDKYWCEIIVDLPLEVNEGSIFFDATARREYLEYWTGKSIDAPQLKTRPEAAHPIIQFVDHDVSRCGKRKPLRDCDGKPIKGKSRGWEGQSPSHAASIISAILQRHPSIKKLGIITHQDTLKALMGDDSDPGLLPKHVTDRIAKTTHFGSGEDRASNEWTQRCDFLLVLGTARPSEDQVRRFLVSIGKTEAAGRQPEWCQQTWTATDGQALAIDRKGYYDDPDWEDAYSTSYRAAPCSASGEPGRIASMASPAPSSARRSSRTVDTASNTPGWETFRDLADSTQAGRQPRAFSKSCSRCLLDRRLRGHLTKCGNP